MADNVPITAGVGTSIAADDIASVWHQRMKVGFGVDGAYVDASATDPIPVTTEQKKNYRAATNQTFTWTNNVNPVFAVFRGVAGKVIRIKRIILSGYTLTAIAYHYVNLRKHSTASTGGTGTTFLTPIPMDSTSAATTAQPVLYGTSGPTMGTLIGSMESRRVLFQNNTAAAAGIPAETIFNERGDILLRSTSEEIALAFITSPASAVTLAITFEWSEE